jgi:hypothetical protein
VAQRSTWTFPPSLTERYAALPLTGPSAGRYAAGTSGAKLHSVGRLPPITNGSSGVIPMGIL